MKPLIKSIIIVILCIDSFFVAAAGGAGPVDAASASKAELRATSLVARMSVGEKAGQVLLVSVGGRGFAPRSSLEMVKNVGPGGILLFGFNVPVVPTGICPALASFQEAAKTSGAGLPLLVAIDHEGGLVFRFHGGITRPPSPLETARRGRAYAALLGRREALELGDLGITMVLGPVVEALTAENRAFLGSRSYGSDPGLVDSTAAAYIRGLAEGGAIAVAKHFPSDGPADPHLSLPRLDVSADRLRSLYLGRFRAAIEAGVPAIMISHIVVEAIDPARPATLSAKVIGILRNELGFGGVVLTDDLLMKALDMPVRLSAPEAIAAGADLLMLSSEAAAIPARDAIVAALRSGRLSERRLDEAVTRVVALKLESAELVARAAAAGAVMGSGAGSDTNMEPLTTPASRCASFASRVAESARLLSAVAADPR